MRIFNKIPEEQKYKAAMAAGADAGNRNMKRHGRNTWNDEDWNKSAEVFDRIFGKITAIERIKK